MPYTLRRVRIASMLKFGFILGSLTAFLPALLCSLLTSRVVSLFLVWLQTWQRLQINLRIEMLEIDLVELLSMGELLARLEVLDRQSVVLVLGLTWGLTFVAGAFTALVGALAAAVYNGVAQLSGGIEVEVEGEGSGAFVPSSGRPGRAPTALLLPQTVGAWLVLASDPGCYWPLAHPVNRIGSAAGSDALLPYNGIAPLHAEIRLEDGRYVLYAHVESGIWVNEHPIAGRNLLKDGFRVRLGAVDFVFRQQGGR